MRIHGLIAVFLLAALPCCSQQTLREQLQSTGIPQNSFSEAQLNAPVDGVGADNGQFAYFAYLLRTGDSGLTGNPQIVRYDKSEGTLLRSEIKPGDDPYCCGSPEGIEFVDDYLLLYFHYNPSAGAVAVLDGKLKQVNILDGFEAERIAPNEVVFTGNMVHFAPTHAEQLNFVDLRYSKVSQLYPSENDALRGRFIKEHGKRMPSPELCRQLDNDACDPEMFDEDVNFLGADGKGQFAIAVDRDASHAPAKGQYPVSVLSESAIYLYAHKTNGWVYCEITISEDQARKFQSGPDRDFYSTVKDRCIPSIPVASDQSN